MFRKFYHPLIVLAASLLPAMAVRGQTAGPIDPPSVIDPVALKTSVRFPAPQLPADNPLDAKRVELGARLFFDPILSRDGMMSCATCHQPGNAFADTVRLRPGADTVSPRQAPPLFNLAWKNDYAWDGRARRVRDQVLTHLQSADAMGIESAELERRLAGRSWYRVMFGKAFGSGAITRGTIALALENYLLTLISQDSRFDRAMRGETSLTTEEMRGAELFATPFDPNAGKMGAGCAECHSGMLFTDGSFHDNGLVSSPDLGRVGVTNQMADMRRFATPSLRNVTATAPYMHDGRFQTLEEVVAHYDHGVKQRAGLDAKLTAVAAKGLKLDDADRRALVAFMTTLTDERFLLSSREQARQVALRYRDQGTRDGAAGPVAMTK